jgi:translation initiation factor 4E
MAQRPTLLTGGLPGISESEAATTASPARGKEMRKKLIQTLRPPPLVYQWEFWHDRQERKQTAPTPTSASAESPSLAISSSPSYESRLRMLHSISDVRDFWEVFNNFDISKLQLRDSIHLFHKGVKPVWEDPRNVKGGSWTFRVQKSQAQKFWQQLCLMAIGEKLQEAVESKRISR